MKAVGGYVLIKPETPKESNLYLLEESQQGMTSLIGEVISVGDAEFFRQKTCSVKVGSWVQIMPVGADFVKVLGGEKVIRAGYASIVAVFTKEEYLKRRETQNKLDKEDVIHPILKPTLVS